MQLNLICEAPHRQPELNAIAEQWGLTHDPESEFGLMLTHERLEPVPYIHLTLPPNRKE